MITDVAQVVQSALREERKLEAISNHLANATTTGFKADILSFDDTLAIRMTTDFSPGEIRQTGNDLDVALSAEGFFKIQTPNGIRYTRNGTFTLDRENQLVTQNGDPVLGESGPILIEGTGGRVNNIHISDRGEIRVDNQLAGRLAVVEFEATEKLKKKGESLFVYDGPATDEKAVDALQIQQGALESSNVVTVIEMTKMVETMRRYEACMKMLQSVDETDSKLINLLGQV